MLSTLITSKSRVEILTWFLGHPGERFHYRELRNILKASGPSIQKELKRLESAGILLSEKEANVRFYSINQEHPLFPELKSIIFKTVGLADYLKESLEDIGHVKAAFIYGSVARNLEDVRSDIDLMVIGQVDIDILHEAVSKAEEALGREVNYSVFSLEDWRKQLAEQKAFVADVERSKKIFLIGNEDDVRKTA